MPCASVVAVGPKHLCPRWAAASPPGPPGPPTHAADRWGSCWPGSAACPHTSYTSTGACRAGSACPAGPTGTPHTRCCCRCSPRPTAVGTPRHKRRRAPKGRRQGPGRGAEQGAVPVPGRPTGCPPLPQREAQEGGRRSPWSRTPREMRPRTDPARASPKTEKRIYAPPPTHSPNQETRVSFYTSEPQRKRGNDPTVRSISCRGRPLTGLKLKKKQTSLTCLIKTSVWIKNPRTTAPPPVSVNQV